eukprot:1189736-Prorocentrum_minimum.AAC.6
MQRFSVALASCVTLLAILSAFCGFAWHRLVHIEKERSVLLGELRQLSDKLDIHESNQHAHEVITSLPGHHTARSSHDRSHKQRSSHRSHTKPRHSRSGHTLHEESKLALPEYWAQIVPEDWYPFVGGLNTTRNRSAAPILVNPSITAYLNVGVLIPQLGRALGKMRGCEEPHHFGSHGCVCCFSPLLVAQIGVHHTDTPVKSVSCVFC